jgi:hypothetical protein
MGNPSSHLMPLKVGNYDKLWQNIGMNMMYNIYIIYIYIYLRCESTLKTTIFFMKESRMEAKSRGIPQDFCDFACAEQKYQIPDCALIVLYPLL